PSSSHARPPPDLHSFPTRRSSDLQDSSGSKSLVLLSAFERPPEAAGDTVNSAVLIAAESVSSYPGLKAAEDYFRPLTEVATSRGDRKSTRLNSSHVAISYAVFCLK